MSTKTEKAVLFLVEGDTDEQSLAGVIRRYLAPRHQRFQVIGTDITSDWDINPKNILDRVMMRFISLLIRKNGLRQIYRRSFN